MHTSITIIRALVLPLLLITVALPVNARQAADARHPERDRTAPPVALVCDRNQLTSYNGQVSYYQRDETATYMTIATDWDTQESISIAHPPPDSIQNYFMLNGQEFPADGWQTIETEPGVLLTGVRVIAWICGDGKTQPVVDWRPQ
jgi:hypothetical protein